MSDWTNVVHEHISCYALEVKEDAIKDIESQLSD